MKRVFLILISSVYSHNLVEIIPAAALANVGAPGVCRVDTVAPDILVSVAPVPGANGRFVIPDIKNGQPAEIR